MSRVSLNVLLITCSPIIAAGGLWISGKGHFSMLVGLSVVLNMAAAFWNLTRTHIDEKVTPKEEQQQPQQQPVESCAAETEDSEERQHADSQLLVDLSADIRTPLQTILNVTESAIVGDLSYAQRKDLATIQTSATSLETILNNIMDIAASEVGQLELNSAEFRLRVMLAELLSSHIQQAKNIGRSLNYLVQTKVPDGLRGDVERLENVLLNLLTYVIAESEDEIELRISCESNQEQKVELLFNIICMGTSIEDSAINMIAENAQSSVEHFTAVDLTLAASAQLIEMIGGRLWVVNGDSQQQVCFTAKFETFEVSESLESVQQTQLGLIPDLQVLLVIAANTEGKALEEMLIRWQTEPTCVSTANEMWLELEKQRIAGEQYSLIIIDAHAQQISGVELCSKLKLNQLYSAIPVVVLTDSDHPEEALEATKVGAAMHLLKPVKSSLLAKAIVKAVLGKGRYKQQRKDLGAAEMYVRSLIPPPTKEPLGVDWRYVPAADIAGDSLGFHWIDEDSFAVYLLDVCGHGLDASLLSVSVLNVLKSMALPETDFRHPDQVLEQLNNIFPMESHGDRCFSAWYGVFDRKKSILTWAGGGHPPALLCKPADSGLELKQLESTGPLIGMLSAMEFTVETQAIAPGDRLYLYSDGVFEIETPSGEQLKFEQFMEFIHMYVPGEVSTLDALWTRARTLSQQETLEDDFTILEVQF